LNFDNKQKGPTRSFEKYFAGKYNDNLRKRLKPLKNIKKSNSLNWLKKRGPDGKVQDVKTTKEISYKK
jgi:hypothetical protein